MVEMKGKGKQRTFWLEASPSNRDVNRQSLMVLEKEVQDMLKTSKTFDQSVHDNCKVSSPRSERHLFKVGATGTTVSERGEEEFVNDSTSTIVPTPLLEMPILEKKKLRTLESASITDDSITDSSFETPSWQSEYGPDDRPGKSEKQKTKCSHARLDKQLSMSKMYFI